MPELFRFLKRNRPVNIAILLLYYAVVVLPHKWFGTFLNTEVFSRMSRSQYNKTVLIIFVILLMMIIIHFIKSIRTNPKKLILTSTLLFSLLLAIIISKTLFVINIEMVHFPQYAILAILLLPLCGDMFQALIIATLAGGIDEAYQYFILAPDDTGYYDFNDVVTNLVGAAIGIIYARAVGWAQIKSRQFIGSPAFYMLILITSILLLLRSLNILTIYPSAGGVVSLVVYQPPTFWSQLPLGLVYHVLTPLEGTIIIILLWAVYAIFFRRFFDTKSLQP